MEIGAVHRFGTGWMSLKLSLKPGEMFIVNGAVVRNGDRRGVLLLENQARILREKDIMQPEEATTPASRTYFAVMQMYLTGQTQGQYYEQFEQAIASWLASADTETYRATVLEISREVTADKLYKALGRCRKLLETSQRSEGKAA